MKDLQRVHNIGRKAGGQFNEALVLTQEDLYPEAKDVYWDLREAHKEIVKPADFEAPFETHLDLVYLQWQCEHGYLQQYPAQELISQLMLGVRYKDDLDMDSDRPVSNNYWTLPNDRGMCSHLS